ncbi:MAG: hypothetical protein LBQ67_05285 [Treponema sp.]|nr:hypothetical protein [Treponema sp.]
MTKKEAGAARNGGRIPSGGGDFDGRFENLVNYAGEKTGGGRTERTLIPPDAVSRLSSA